MNLCALMNRTYCMFIKERPSYCYLFHGKALNYNGFWVKLIIFTVAWVQLGNFWCVKFKRCSVGGIPTLIVLTLKRFLFACPRQKCCHWLWNLICNDTGIFVVRRIVFRSLIIDLNYYNLLLKEFPFLTFTWGLSLVFLIIYKVTFLQISKSLKSIITFPI